MLLFPMDPVCGDTKWEYNPLTIAESMFATFFCRFSILGFAEISSKQNCLNALIFNWTQMQIWHSNELVKFVLQRFSQIILMILRQINFFC